MNLKNSLEKIRKFETDEETEDYEVSEFFDEIGDDFSHFEITTAAEKEQVLETFFDFLRRQSPELEENWSFIHLIERIDKPTYQIYRELLFNFNEANPTLISILLLNRFINSLKGQEWEKGVQLLKEISEREELTTLLKGEAKDYYEHQLKQK